MKPTERYDSLFQYYGLKSGIPWRLLKAQALAESGLDPDAKSRVGALGLAQFMPATWADLAIRQGWASPSALIDPRDPEDAIRAQGVYLRWLLTETKYDIKLALAAYNWGIGRVRRTFLEPGRKYDPALVPVETRDYIAKVLVYFHAA